LCDLIDFIETFCQFIALIKQLNIQQAVNNLTDVEIKDRDLFWNVRFTVETIEHSLYQFC